VWLVGHQVQVDGSVYVWGLVLEVVLAEELAGLLAVVSANVSDFLLVVVLGEGVWDVVLVCVSESWLMLVAG
jgi:hypothetical protein